MAQIKLWAFSLCAAAVLSALAQMLFPSKEMGKPLSMVVNLYVLLCLVSPMPDILSFGGWSGKIEPPSEASIRAVDADVLLRAEIESRMLAVADGKLQSMGINPKDIRIDITVSREALDIAGVTVVLTSDDWGQRDRVSKELADYLGMPVDVTGENEVM